MLTVMQKIKNMNINKSLFYGKSRRKVEQITLDMSSPELVDGRYIVNAMVSGLPDEFNRSRTTLVEIGKLEGIGKKSNYPSLKMTVDGLTEFDAIVMGLAFLRQSLRSFIESSPSSKIYGKYGEDLEVLEIEDIFWTHDCLPD